MSRTPGVRGRTALSDQSRALPDRPNLRFLKVEAKRRLAAGEFDTLQETQLSIAREHGFSSWTALKQSVEASPALAHVRWVLARFGDADGPAWEPPGEAELREHLDDSLLALVPVQTLVDSLAPAAERLRADLVVAAATPSHVRARVADLRVDAEAGAEPPHLLTGLLIYPIGPRVTDERAGAPATTVTSGAVPAGAADVLAESITELGLPGLVLAGASWSAARGWADLDRGRKLRTDHRFPAHGITKVVTATTVLRLVAAGRVSLDAPANEWLATIRLADTVTVRELLTHTGGVTSAAKQFAERVPAAGTLESIVDCGNQRGTFVPSNAGFEVLGQLIADVTGTSYPDAVASLVFEPLDLSGSSFPTAWPTANAVTGYALADDGTFAPAAPQVCTMPAAGGLWTTAADLVRFGHGWVSLLPADLVAEALRPQVTQTITAGVGLGWLLHPGKDLYGHPGGGPGGATSLVIRCDSNETTVACTNRHVIVEPVAARLVS